MGIPYSRQIHSAFDQVTPLVAAGFEVLRTTKNIAIFLACLQVFVALVLSLQLCALLGLIITVSPDLEPERAQLVTPIVRWLAAWVLEYGGVILWILKFSIVAGTATMGVLVWIGGLAGTRVPGEGSGDGAGEGDDKEGVVGDG
ncbi:hypothetical protein PFICI_10329 [Pestalotiopsis fici W106-1]|uniref:Uncharacterized protein n=1 Tax=Pestalotiopsis fici (strain W106-1 / CGMCC3.15140) TaxID=1229662 RepID=W3WYU0_PESFW|nr:uncharacterized protein PFICI_10329 [Pestalotiopsis fici W106-1]ETS78267.1 hypothetical protein PFICI_10329 [Pestalotiopsis fici W106-1]